MGVANFIFDVNYCILNNTIMKYLKLFTAVTVLAIFTAVACKKDTPEPENKPKTGVCSGGNICFKMDGNSEVYTAEWRKIPANANSPERYRIYVELIGSTPNIEMDMYGTTTGTYTVNSNNPHVANEGDFKYFETTGKNIKGTSGTIEVTNIDNTNNTISGTFTVTGDDNGTTYKITEGNFENVPLK